MQQRNTWQRSFHLRMHHGKSSCRVNKAMLQDLRHRLKDEIQHKNARKNVTGILTFMCCASRIKSPAVSNSTWAGSAVYATHRPPKAKSRLTAAAARSGRMIWRRAAECAGAAAVLSAAAALCGERRQRRPQQAAISNCVLVVAVAVEGAKGCPTCPFAALVPVGAMCVVCGGAAVDLQLEGLNSRSEVLL